MLSTASDVIVRKPLLSVVVSNAISLLTVLLMYSRSRGGVWKVVSRALFRLILGVAAKTPGAAGMLSKETNKMREDIKKQLLADVQGEERYETIPKKGWTSEQVLDALRKSQAKDEAKWVDGKVSGCVYHGQPEMMELLAQAQGMFLLSNPLHPDVFPSVRKMEAEVVTMVSALFRAPVPCGTITSGGTESILMACRAAKNFGAHTRGIVEPEMVIPSTAHAAFDKAAEYFGIRIVRIEVDPKTKRADVEATRRAVTKNTVLIVGSSPCYAYGCIDPIKELGRIATQNNTLLHVDCCLGSLLTPFARRAGYLTQEFDFSVEGVTSISCDTHKYGYASKGSSVVLYRSHELRHHQYFICPSWNGGLYATPTIGGSRAGATSVAAWAAIMHMGENGFEAATKQIMEAAKRIEDGVKSLPFLQVLGSRDLSVVSFASREDPLDVYNVGDAMHARGWNLNSLQYPPAVHICVTVCNAPKADTFVSDLRASVEEVQRLPKEKRAGKSAKIYGMAQSLPDTAIVEDISKVYIDTLFLA